MNKKQFIEELTKKTQEIDTLVSNIDNEQDELDELYSEYRGEYEYTTEEQKIINKVEAYIDGNYF